MATTTVPISTTQRKRWLLRTFGVFLVVILLASAAVAAWFYSVARSALPQIDGTMVLPRLSGKVTVTRDVRGIPTIDAASLADLFLAQGYVTAEDRPWQMRSRRFSDLNSCNMIARNGSSAYDRLHSTPWKLACPRATGPISKPMHVELMPSLTRIAIPCHWNSAFSATRPGPGRSKIVF